LGWEEDERLGINLYGQLRQIFEGGFNYVWLGFYTVAGKVLKVG